MTCLTPGLQGGLCSRRTWTGSSWSGPVPGTLTGVVALYEPGAVLAFPPGHLAIGTEAIRQVYAELLARPAHPLKTLHDTIIPDPRPAGQTPRWAGPDFSAGS